MTDPVMDMDVERLQNALLNEVAAARDLAALDEVRVSALGKKGRDHQPDQGPRPARPRGAA